jgi:plastocyanin
MPQDPNRLARMFPAIQNLDGRLCIPRFGFVLLVGQRYAHPMKTRNLIIAGLVAASLSIGLAARAAEEKEQEIKASDVPAAVQKAADTEVKGGKIVRWEKEGDSYEAVVEKKNGKQVGIKFNADGKVLSKHNESKEHQEQKY